MFHNVFLRCWLKETNNITSVGDVRTEEDTWYQVYTYVSRRGRESRGNVSPFSPVSVCNLVCVSCREMLEIYAYAEAVGQRDLQSTVDLLYRDKIPSIGGSNFRTLANLIIGVTLCVFSPGF